MSADHFAAIEAGGTKFLCAIADDRGNFVEQRRIATMDPASTFAEIDDFFHNAPVPVARLQGAGIASFGPLDLDRSSPDFGALTTTPKPGWASVNMREAIAAILRCPTEIETDVNCAALAEGLYGAAVGLSRFCYMTVGTGIGVGIVENGKILAGAGHPEVGHIRVPHAPGDEFKGTCLFHGDCAEGLASGPAMKARWLKSAEDLPEDHVAWTYEAHYIAAICVNLTYALRPQRIILGGGVMERSSLYGPVCDAFARLLAGYALDRYCQDAPRFLAAPALTSPSPGLVGALELARRASEARHV